MGEGGPYYARWFNDVVRRRGHAPAMARSWIWRAESHVEDLAVGFAEADDRQSDRFSQGTIETGSRRRSIDSRTGRVDILLVAEVVT